MRSILIKAICLALILFAAGAAKAQINRLKLDNVGYKGIGCPLGSVQVTLSPDQGALSFLFDRYSIQVPAGGRASMGCDLHFQMTPPYGYQLRVMGVDYRGFSALSEGARARLVSEIRQTSQNGMRVIGTTKHDRIGPTNDVFDVTSVTGEGPLSSCSGWPVIINLSTRMDLLNQSRDPGELSLDSADLSMTPGTTLHLAWVPCKERPRFPPTPAPSPSPRPPRPPRFDFPRVLNLIETLPKAVISQH